MLVGIITTKIQQRIRRRTTLVSDLIVRSNKNARRGAGKDSRLESRRDRRIRCSKSWALRSLSIVFSPQVLAVTVEQKSRTCTTLVSRITTGRCTTRQNKSPGAGMRYRAEYVMEER